MFITNKGGDFFRCLNLFQVFKFEINFKNYRFLRVSNQGFYYCFIFPNWSFGRLAGAAPI